MKNIALAGGWILTVIITALIIVSALDHLDAFSSKDALYGFDYIPALWIGALAVLPVILLLLSGKRINALQMCLVVSIYIVAFGDFSFAFLIPKNLPSKELIKKLTVAALNVQYYNHGVDEVMDGLLSLNTDVVLLSENFLPDSLYSRVRQKNTSMQLYMGHQNSTAILSRYPIVGFKEIELPSHEASLSGSNDINDLIHNPHRSFVHAMLNVDGSYVHIISVRLIAGRPKNHTIEENLRWGKYLIASQAEEIDALVAYLRGLHGPIIFGGDMNAPPSSKPIRKIRRIATDAYMENHFFGDYTFRTELPMMRLDYLFCMNNVFPEHARRPQLKVSDHFPVVADFLIPINQAVQLKEGSMFALHGEAAICEIPK